MKSRFLKKLLSAALAVTTCAGMVAGMTGCDSGSSDEIKIGLLFSKTGATAITEECMINAAQMAIDEVNEAGGINGKKITYVLEDYATDAATAAEKIKKLIMQDEAVATVGCYTSASRIACEPVVEDNDSLLIYPTFYEGEEPSKNVVYTGAVPNQQGDIFVPWLVENVGKKFFLLGTDTVYAQLINTQCRASLEECGGEVVGEEYVPNAHNDFSSIITKIKEADPDVLFVNLNGDSGVAFFKQYKQYGLDAATMPVASYLLDESTVAALGADTAAGHYTSINYVSTLDTDANNEFLKKYHEKFGDDAEMTVVGEETYVSVKLLAEALKKTDDYSSASIIKAMDGITLDVPEGEVKFDPETNHLYLRGRIAKVSDEGKFEVVYESPDLIKPDPTK